MLHKTYAKHRKQNPTVRYASVIMEKCVSPDILFHTKIVKIIVFIGLTQNGFIPSITPSEIVDIRGIHQLSRLHKLTVYATVRKS